MSRMSLTPAETIAQSRRKRTCDAESVVVTRVSVQAIDAFDPTGPVRSEKGIFTYPGSSNAANRTGASARKTTSACHGCRHCTRDDLASGNLGEHAPAERADERQPTALRRWLPWGMGAHCKFAEPKNRSHDWRRHEIHLAGSCEGDVRRSIYTHIVLLGNIVCRDEAIEQHVMRGAIALAGRPAVAQPGSRGEHRVAERDGAQPAGNAAQ